MGGGFTGQKHALPDHRRGGAGGIWFNGDAPFRNIHGDMRLRQIDHHRPGFNAPRGIGLA